MRDFLVILVVMGGLPYVLAKPYIGIYLWSWIGYMNPHRLSWGFAYEFPFAALIGATTLIAMLFSKEKKPIPATEITIVLGIFIFWMCITTLFATNSEAASAELVKVLKIQVMTFVTIMLLGSRDKLEKLLWVIVLSIGFYGVKGGVFTIASGGQYMVLGPYGTFIGGNTSMAFAEIMVLPLMRYLQLQASRGWVRWGLGFAMALTVISIIGSYSRGAFLAGAAIALFLIWKSKKRVPLLIGAIILVPLAITSMPDKYTGRMETIKTYEQDASALGRLGAWQFAYEVAKQRFFGGGYEVFTPENYQLFAPEVQEMLVIVARRDPSNMPDAHSIYFEVLGEHGFIGLGLFLTLGILAWRTASRISAIGRSAPDKAWAGDMASMVQVSMVGYAVGGAFLGLAYFDLYYHLLAVIVLLDQIIRFEHEEGLSRKSQTAMSKGFNGMRNGTGMRL